MLYVEIIVEIDFEIDKITNSIEDAETGQVLKTLVLPLEKADLKDITKKNGWLFDWKYELSQPERQVYKLVIQSEQNIIQGLVSLERKSDHVFMHLIESAPFNRGKGKNYLGIACNLTAYGCKLSMDYGLGGVIAFDSKTELIEHYIKILEAVRIGGRRLAVLEDRAEYFINQYFPKKEEL